jgi:hypothetical protein
MAVTAPWQFSFNGLDFGGGSAIQLLQADGLRSMPAVRSGDVGRPRADGMLAGLDLLGSRTITLKLQVFGTPQTPLDAQITALETAFAIQRTTPQPFVYQLTGGGVRQVLCRPRKRDIVIDPSYANAGFAIVNIMLETVDPRVYDFGGSFQSVGLPQPASTVGFPITFPVTWGVSLLGGFVTVTNSGNTATPVKIQVQGPCLYPMVSNTTLGQYFRLNMVLAATDSVVIDCDFHTVTLNGTTGRRSAMAPGSAWPTLPVGTYQFNFTSSDPSPTGAQMTVSWFNAYL